MLLHQPVEYFCLFFVIVYLVSLTKGNNAFVIGAEIAGPGPCFRPQLGVDFIAYLRVSPQQFQFAAFASAMEEYLVATYHVVQRHDVRGAIGCC